MTDDSANILFQSFLREANCEQFWHGQGCPVFNTVQPTFSLPTTVSPTLQGVLTDGAGEAVVPCDMNETCEFPSLDSCQKKFLSAHKEVDLALHPVVGLVQQMEMRSSFYTLDFKNLDPLLRINQQGPCPTAIEGD